MDSRAPAEIFESVSPYDINDPSTSSMAAGHLESPRNGNSPSVASSLAHSLHQQYPSKPPIDPTSCFEGVHVMNSSKDADDPSIPVERSRRRRSNVVVPTTLSKLLAIQAPLSPASSRATSYNAPMTNQRGQNYGPTGVASLPAHLYHRGLIDGKYSDITLNAFGAKYHLHRLVLDRSPYFASLFSGPWSESRAREINLYPEDIDANITRAAFELALKRLYGCQAVDDELPEAIGMLAVGSWLDMQDLVEESTDMLIKSLESNNLGPLVFLITSNCYGKPTEKILIAAKALLSRDGWNMPLKCWDDIPAQFINDVLSSDGLFVPSEYERFTLARRLLDCRLKQLSRQSTCMRHESVTDKSSHIGSALLSLQSYPEQDFNKSSIYEHPEVSPFLSTLDSGIYYIHMDFEQLQSAKLAKDFLGNTVVPRKRITDALWTSVEFRQRIVRAKSKQLEVQLTESLENTSLSAVDNHRGGDLGYEVSPSEPPKRFVNQSVAHVPASEPVYNFLKVKESIEDQRRFWVPEEDINIVLGGLRDSFTRQIVSESAQAEVSRSRPQSLLDSLRQLPKPYSQSRSDQMSGVYTRFPPFRFSVEFKDLRNLKENRRIHSRTVWYAGSYWNVYVVRKPSQDFRSPQVGVYLERKQAHPGATDLVRSNHDEPLNSAKGVVDERIRHLEREMRWLRSQSLYLSNNTSRSNRPQTHRHDSHRQSHTYHSSRLLDNSDDTNEQSSAPSHHDCVDRVSMSSRASSLSAFIMGSGQYRNSMISRTNSSNSRRPVSSLYTNYSSIVADTSSSSEEHESNLFEHPSPSPKKKQTRTSETALPLYTDSRPVIKAYFKIISPVNGGRMLNVLESGPDIFSSSRRPGWSNINMCLENHQSVDAAAKMSNGNNHEEEEADISEGLGLGGLDATEARHSVGRRSSTDTSTGTFWEEDDEDSNDDEQERKETAAALVARDGSLKFMVVIGIV